MGLGRWDWHAATPGLAAEDEGPVRGISWHPSTQLVQPGSQTLWHACWAHACCGTL